MMGSNKVVFDVNEIAKYLRVSQSSVRKMVRMNAIPYYRVLSRIFFDKDSIDLWIANQENFKALGD